MPNVGTVHMRWEGLEQLQRVLESGGEAAQNEIGPALWDVASDAFAESQRMVPVETGTLRSSGSVSNPLQLADGWSVKIAYGGAAAPYAVYVHEDLEVSHDAPTSAKYLEIPVKNAADTMPARLAEAVVDRMAAESA